MGRSEEGRGDLGEVKLRREVGDPGGAEVEDRATFVAQQDRQEASEPGRVRAYCKVQRLLILHWEG